MAIKMRIYIDSANNEQLLTVKRLIEILKLFDQNLPVYKSEDGVLDGYAVEEIEYDKANGTLLIS